MTDAQTLIAEDRTRVLAALYEARLQLIYIDERFPTGTTPAVISHIDRALEKAVPWETFASAMNVQPSSKEEAV